MATVLITIVFIALVLILGKNSPKIVFIQTMVEYFRLFLLNESHLLLFNSSKSKMILCVFFKSFLDDKQSKNRLFIYRPFI